MAMWLQEGHATLQLSGKLEELREQVEEGRNAVIEAHRELLDMADGSIARVNLCLLAMILPDVSKAHCDCVQHYSCVTISCIPCSC